MKFVSRTGELRSKLSPKFILHRAVTTLYQIGGRTPGSKGNMSFRQEYIFRTLHNKKLMTLFREGKPLPAGFGRGLDERVVEYPWALSLLEHGSGTVLDAGSTLNFEFIASHPHLQQKKIVIYTLSPQGENQLQKLHVSYIYGDLRETVLRDAWFDTIVCISTIEHIGMDNIKYTEDANFYERDVGSYQQALGELYRLLKPAGSLLLTVPYGRPQNLGWMQQFDRARLQDLIDSWKGSLRSLTYFKSTPSGWQHATAEECKDCEYVEQTKPHYNQATAVACLVLGKH